MRRLVAAALLLCAASNARAVSQSGAVLLNYPVSARAIAIGWTGVADNTDPFTAYFNPANAAAPSRLYAQGAWWDYVDSWFSDVSFRGGNAGGSTALAGAPRTLGFDASLRRLNFGKSVVTDTAGNVLGELTIYEEALSLAAGAGFALGESDELRVGAAIKRWWADYPPAEVGTGLEEKPSAIAGDVGVVLAMHRSVSGWDVTPALGLACVDIGSDIRFAHLNDADPLPTRFNFGASVRFESPAQALGTARVPLIAAVCNLDGTEPRHGDFNWGVGMELAMAQILFVRTGVRATVLHDKPDTSVSSWGIGLGLPVGPVRARFDYAHSLDYWKNQTGLSLEWRY